MVGIEEGIVEVEVEVEVHTDIEAMKNEGMEVIVTAEGMMIGIGIGIETGITTMKGGLGDIGAQALFIGIQKEEDTLVLLEKVVKKGVQKLSNGIDKGNKQKSMMMVMSTTISIQKTNMSIELVPCLLSGGVQVYSSLIWIVKIIILFFIHFT